MPGYCHQQHEETQRLDWEEEKENREKKPKRARSLHALRFVVTLWENHSSHGKPAVCKTVDPHVGMKDGDDIRRASIRYEISFVFFSLIPVPNRCHLISNSGDSNTFGRSETHKRPKHTYLNYFLSPCKKNTFHPDCPAFNSPTEPVWQYFNLFKSVVCALIRFFFMQCFNHVIK